MEVREQKKKGVTMIRNVRSKGRGVESMKERNENREEC